LATASSGVVMGMMAKQSGTSTSYGQLRAARGDRPAGRTPRACACGCTRQSAARRPEGAALNQEGEVGHEARFGYRVTWRAT
jgi:hypothetical protein